MHIDELNAQLRPKLESAILVRDEIKLKVLIAVNSGKGKRMAFEDVQELTNLDEKGMNNAINFLESANCIEIITDEIPGKSLHKVCILTEYGRKILGELGIE